MALVSQNDKRLGSKGDHASPRGKTVELNYRPDIDGLRSVAVISVLIFHFFPEVLQGGFAGVDVFFCISGFLISGILIKNLRNDRFSIVDFYGRRIRRIFPALIVVLIFTLIVGRLLLVEDEYKELGLQALGGAIFVSNFVFYFQSGYFNMGSATKPLLHLWSLGVEEQFYIFWPLLLAVAWRFRISLGWAIWAILIVSFGCNLAQTLHSSPWYDTDAAFYLPFARFWQLGSGALLAYYADSGWRTAPAMLRSGVSVGGLALLLFFFVKVGDFHPYPGVLGIIPTMGAMALIWAGPRAFVNRWLLSNRIAVWVGLISYPLYLWHWPLASFAYIVNGQTPSVAVRVGLMLLSFPLAALTYCFVERPIRFGPSRRPAPALAAVMSTIAAVSLTIVLTGTFGQFPYGQVTPEAAGDVGHDTFHAYVEAHSFPCGPEDLKNRAARWGVRCLQSRQGDRRDIALIGDSHAEHLFPGIAEIFSDMNVLSFTRGGSIPYANEIHSQDVFNYVLADPNLHVVILAAFWGSTINRLPRDVSAFDEMVDTVKRLWRAGKRVYLISDNPNFGFDAEKCKYLRWFGQPQCAESADKFMSEWQFDTSFLRRIAAAVPGTTVLDPASYLCDQTTCTMEKEGTLFFRDRNHLNIDGSRYIARALRRDGLDSALGHSGKDISRSTL